MRKSCQHVSRIVIQQVFIGYPIVIEGTRTHCMLVRYYWCPQFRLICFLSQFRFCGTHTHILLVLKVIIMFRIFASYFLGECRCLNVVNVNVNIKPNTFVTYHPFY